MNNDEHNSGNPQRHGHRARPGCMTLRFGVRLGQLLRRPPGDPGGTGRGQRRATRSPTARTSTPRGCRRCWSSTSAPGIECFPVFNGTGANVLSLQSLLPRWGAVICASTAHINMDENGAPERVGGIKLLQVPTAGRQAHA